MELSSSEYIKTAVSQKRDTFVAYKNTRDDAVKEAEKRGVTKKRIIFVQHIERALYLARYKVTDLFLDTFPYNAHTGAVDALKVNLPLISISGKSFAARVSESFLSALKLFELTVDNQENYEKFETKDV